MKERQRWRAEEDALLTEYVRRYGPREWHLVSHRMTVALDRDAKSCLERWKNYLKPGIKKGSLTEDEQRLVIRLQARHGNKWKKIAAQVPGRTAKRLGKWWEVFKEKQQRIESKDNPDHHFKTAAEPVDDAKYDLILKTFAEKLVKECSAPTTYLMVPTPNGGFRPADPSPPPLTTTLLPPWLSNQTSSLRPPSPSVTLSLSPSTVAATPTTTNTFPWLQPERIPDNISNGNAVGNSQPHGSIPVCGDNRLVSELEECCRELEEGHRALAAHKKESAWRLRRVELQLESEKAGSNWQV